MGIFIFIIILLFNFSVFAAPVFKKGDEIKGHVSYIFDGDTISIDDYRIRFQGIDCPETMQLCKDKISKNYKCGIHDASLACHYAVDTRTSSAPHVARRQRVSCKGD